IVDDGRWVGMVPRICVERHTYAWECGVSVKRWVGQDGGQGVLGLWVGRICVEGTHMRGEPESV
ncbi:hypothetical protein PIB30_105646, partial [Stylosanthes scabra]|nr:hypothetical protein [Stylosanthes scabra]